MYPALPLLVTFKFLTVAPFPVILNLPVIFTKLFPLASVSPTNVIAFLTSTFCA